MKNKFMFVAFVFILFSSAVFAAADVDKEYNLRKRTKTLEEQVRLLQSQFNVTHPGMPKSAAKLQKTGDYDKENKNRFDTLVEMYAHGPAVVSSPAFGVRRAAADEFEDRSEERRVGKECRSR